MRVMICWSGDRSSAVASALRKWLPDVIQAVKPWMSSADIRAGAGWLNDVREQLAETHFGILCLTPENVNMPWLLFEAGALAKSLDKRPLVCPYFIGGLTQNALPSGPLTQFQGKSATEEDTLALVETINAVAADKGLASLPADQLQRAFARCWPELDAEIQRSCQDVQPTPARRSNEEMIEELLGLVRGLSQRKEPRDDAAQKYADRSLAQLQAESASLRALLTERLMRADLEIRHREQEQPVMSLYDIPAPTRQYLAAFASRFAQQTPQVAIVGMVANGSTAEPSALAGEIDVWLAVNASASAATSINLLVDDSVVCTQPLSPYSTICCFNAGAKSPTGERVFEPGPHVLTAQLIGDGGTVLASTTQQLVFA